MTDRSQTPLKKGYLYVATSDRLQEWALRNDRLYLFKIGFAAHGTERLDYLNGKIQGRANPPRPCLNFTDWRFVARWEFETRQSAAAMEALIHEIFDEIFDRFDRNELIQNLRSGNGETEIFRLRLKTLPDAVSKLGTFNINAAIWRQAIAVLEKSAIDIVEGRARRSAALLASLPGGDWNDDDLEELEEDDRHDTSQRYNDLVSQSYDDLDAEARASEEGWPYEDGDNDY
jgi:hypothetical protein